MLFQLGRSRDRRHENDDKNLRVYTNEAEGVLNATQTRKLPITKEARNEEVLAEKSDSFLIRVSQANSEELQN